MQLVAKQWGNKWQPCSKASPSNAFCPIIVTTWVTSRASLPSGICSHAKKHAASHLLILKGTHFLHPILMDAKTTEFPFTNKDMQGAWVSSVADKEAIMANDNQPKWIIKTSNNPTTFWYCCAVLPLPPNHNLP
jgi:hypothetical protein